MWLQLFLYQLFVVLVFAKTSKYIRSKVLVDTCDNSIKIQEVVVRSEHHCALKCSGSPTCRRYGYCMISGNRMCLLYSSGANCVTNSQPNQCKCFRKISTCENGVCLCPIGYYGNNCENIITDCTDGYNRGWADLGQILSFVKPSLSPEPFEILCHFKYGGIAHVLTRFSNCTPDHYNRSYSEYRQGFGDASTNHWIGLDKFYHLTKERNNWKLNMFFMTGLSYTLAQCYYKSFSMTDASDRFRLQLSGFYSHNTETCSNSWTESVNINNAPFSAIDDDVTANGCPSKMAAGGWFSTTDPQCTRGNLFGMTDIWKDGLEGATFHHIYLRLIG